MSDFPYFLIFIMIGFIFLLGLAFTVATRKIWEVFQSWKAEREPPDSYFIFMKICGIILIIISLIFLTIVVKDLRADDWFSSMLT